MERHFSIGTATIVALMAAHRSAQSCDDRALACAFREEVARIDDRAFPPPAPDERRGGDHILRP
jgi:hypothetical protein